MSNQLISLAGWTFIPSFATQWIQSIFYHVSIRAGDPKPQPGSVLYNTHRRCIYLSVVCAYFLFTIYEADWEIQKKPDFYQALQVPLTATDREIKLRFRRLAALYHPDKLATSSLSTEANFVHLKLAQDTLLNPIKRFAYDRFGPDMLEWERCSSTRDYLIQGLQQIIPQYFGTTLILSLFGLLGFHQHGTFWRWFTVSTLCIFELYTISRPQFPRILNNFLNPVLSSLMGHPPYLPFQLIQILKKSSLVLHIAVSQIAPYFPSTKANASQDMELKSQMAELEAKARTLDIETIRLLNLEMTPFSLDKSNLNLVENKMREWLVQNTIRMDPSVRDTFDKIFKKKIMDAAADTSNKFKVN
ncbi:hypothetical protein K3495_g741 [Podosphaera aphanis]|nr:hypothetical protein K3495_g741 [Podosphaera aphanis]